jgi:L-Ala-D/L-Glu epimerase
MNSNLLILETQGQMHLPRIEELRYRILRQPLAMARSTASFPEDLLESTTHVIALDGEALIACATLLNDPAKQRIQLRGMAVHQEQQGRGIGALILHRIHTVSQRLGGQLWCNARQSAVGFYEKNGWAKVESFFDVPVLGPHIIMEWRGGFTKHF